MIKVMSIFGTRPEAIKMCPLVKALENEPQIESVVCVTAQHREMLDQVLEVFEVTPDYDLDLMSKGQTLTEVTTRILTSIEEILQKEKPDMILVHGDTNTTFSSAVAAFYNGIQVGHVEAGLRSGNIHSPFPEEANRKLTGVVTSLHFAPTEGNVQNLLDENVDPNKIVKTGNTVIDALKWVLKANRDFKDKDLKAFDFDNKRIIFMTAHRRENIGKPMYDFFKGIRRGVDEFDDVELIYSVHLNPKVREIANEVLGNHSRIHLIEPLDYVDLANIYSKSTFIVTDSGGVQEEGPAIGKPVLVLRTETERPEAVEAGTVRMSGIEEEQVYQDIKELLTDQEAYDKMANAVNPYGDGTSCAQIVEAILAHFNK